MTRNGGAAPSSPAWLAYLATVVLSAMFVAWLMDLQQAGRMVGIISHVSELKEQMDIRVDLSKSNQGGSSLKVVSPIMGGVQQ